MERNIFCKQVLQEIMLWLKDGEQMNTETSNSENQPETLILIVPQQEKSVLQKLKK